MTGKRGAILARGSVNGSSTHVVAGPNPPPAPPPQPGSPGLTGSDGAIVAGQDVNDSHTDYRS
ncbi:hypothetical protein [Streptomyces sp. NPDC048445]|uniref:hypothetical protein n=1 Tax=Streptomyces sp. NPDC048445 TaxID=3365553 RepID=UPI0037143EED